MESLITYFIIFEKNRYLKNITVKIQRRVGTIDQFRSVRRPFLLHSKKRVLSVLKRKETGHLYGGTERNRSNRTGSKELVRIVRY